MQFLKTDADVEQALDESTAGGVWILKHSDDCGLSENAFEIFVAHSDESSLPHKVLVVQSSPGLSRRVATVLNVEHETPQALLVVGRQVKWTASHREITRLALVSAEA